MYQKYANIIYRNSLVVRGYGQEEDNIMTTAAARSESKTTPETPRHVSHDIAFGLRWSSDELGSVTLKVVEFGHTWDNSDDAQNVWALIPVTGKPEKLEVNITYRLKPGVKILHFGERIMRDVTGTRIPTLTVPITWNGDTPSIRSKHKDNIDLVLYNDLGGFVMIEVGLTTRKGRFYLTLQEMYAGQVVHTNPANAKKAGYEYHVLNKDKGLVATVLPLWEHCAYPGADFMKTWKQEGEKIVELLYKESKTIALSRAEAAVWNPPEMGVAKEEGRVRGICTFFNIAATYGFILVPETGEIYFVHFSDIQREFTLQPMKVYEFTPKMENGKRKALAVRRVVQ
jgi:cold shock CspA family protein